KSLEKDGISLSDRLFISDRAHVIKQEHINLDVENENSTFKLGTTKKGIGPCYEDKIGRRGLTMGKIRSQYISKYVCDTSFIVNKALDLDQEVIFEGAQGSMLDIDHGTYPFVTSSSSIAGGACTGVGVGPTKIEEVIGVSKA